MRHPVRFAALFGLVLSSLAHAEPRPVFSNWIALQVDDQIVTAQEIRDNGGDAIHVWGSMANPAHVDQVFKEIDARLSKYPEVGEYDQKI